jgi:hypothetical protein
MAGRSPGGHEAEDYRDLVIVLPALQAVRAFVRAADFTPLALAGKLA